MHWAGNVCDKNKLQTELTRIKGATTWNVFLERITDVIINNKRKGLNVNNIKNRTNNVFGTIQIKISYVGDKGYQLLKPIKRKLKRHFT